MPKALLLKHIIDTTHKQYTIYLFHKNVYRSL